LTSRSILEPEAPPEAAKESHHQHPGRARDIFPGVTGADTPEWAVIADSAARLVRTAQALTDDDLHEASALVPADRRELSAPTWSVPSRIA
jgi:hypothetical protein